MERNPNILEKKLRECGYIAIINWDSNNIKKIPVADIKNQNSRDGKSHGSRGIVFYNNHIWLNYTIYMHENETKFVPAKASKNASRRAALHRRPDGFWKLGMT